MDKWIKTKMMPAIVFIGYDEKGVQRKGGLQLFSVAPRELCHRIAMSFVPPFGRAAVIKTDLLGPLLAVIALVLLLNCGDYYKEGKIRYEPTAFAISYAFIVSLIHLFLTAIPTIRLEFVQLASLFGYSMYGHIGSLVVSYFLSSNESHCVFLACMVLIAGLSTLRYVLLMVHVIPLHPMRVFVSASFVLLQLLALLVMQYGFMHPTFSKARERKGLGNQMISM